MLHCKLVTPLTGPELQHQGWGAIAPPYVSVQQYSDNIAFTIFLPPAKLQAHHKEALKFFKLLANSTQPLPHKDPIGFIGKCNSFRWRAAMTPGQPCRHYTLMPSQAHQELWEANQHQGLAFIQALERAVQSLLPTIFNSHVQLIQSIGLPTIKGSCTSTNFFITQNYQAHPHFDPFNHKLGCVACPSPPSPAL
jgi:hypothetical protein